MEGCYNVSNSFKDSILKECFSGVTLPGNELPGWFNYVNEGPSVSFIIPEIIDGELEGFNVCIVCSSHVAKLQTKRIGITVTNHTKGCNKTFSFVAINLGNSDEDHLWQGLLLKKDFKIGNEDKVEITVNCGKIMTVKKTGICLVCAKDEKGAIAINDDEAVAKEEVQLKNKRGLNVDDEDSKKSGELATAKDDSLLKAWRGHNDKDGSNSHNYNDNGEAVAKDETMVEAHRHINVVEGARSIHDGEQQLKIFSEHGGTFPFKQEKGVLDIIATKIGWDGGRFLNIYCNCGKRAAIEISKSENNWYRLYYNCPDETCSLFLGWAIDPTSTSVNGDQISEPRKREDDDYTRSNNDLLVLREENKFYVRKEGTEMGDGYMKDTLAINEVKMLREENKLLFSKMDGTESRVMYMKMVIAACLVCNILFVVVVLVVLNRSEEFKTKRKLSGFSPS